jgi:hypothetical protein
MIGEQAVVGKNRKWLLRSASALTLVAIVTVSLYSLARGAPESSGGPAKSNAVKLEAIPGTTTKRVTLSAKAAERLGIETGEVREETLVHEQMVGGTIVPPTDGQQQHVMVGRSFAGFSPVPAAATPQQATTAPVPSGQVWVQVTLSQGEYNRLAKDQNARLEQLQTREKFERELIAEPVNLAPMEDMKRSMLTLYYSVPERNHGLELYQRVRVELPLIEEASGPQKVVPYSAVYYDAKGVAWVYVTSQPLIYERQQIDIDRVVGGLAVLKGGPAVGTKIVSVGAAMLYGTEIFGK